MSINIERGGVIRMWLWIQEQIIHSNTMINKIVYSIISLIIILILKQYTQKLIKTIGEGQERKYKHRKVLSGIYAVLYLLCLLIIWQKSSTSILTLLGFLSAGFTIAIRDVFVNLIGGLYILFAKPFKVGERIEVAGQIGDVIDVNLLHFTMLEVGNRIMQEQSTGRILHMPNMLVFSGPLANYETGFKYIWNEMTVKLDLTSDLEQAKALFYEIIEKYSSDYIEEAKKQIETASKQYLICYNNLTPIIYTEIKDGAIWLSLRYLCEPRKVRVTENLIWEEILKCIQDKDNIKLL